MSDYAIQVRGLGKRYALGGRRKPYKTIRESLVETLAAPFRRRAAAANDAASPTSFWALKDVSFTVNPGEVVGVIGRNGAGKSTLLKVLSRITDPTEGEVEVVGRVGSLLEVGTGFHPELTGRENVYLNGAILGMRRAEISRKFDEIVAFAETERFLDTPVKHYSSGMYTRLAFAVAAHLDPEILVVDEVLAVGDAQFQKKCMGKMHDVAGQGRTVLFVSHNLAAVENLCTRGLYLVQGRVEAAGAIGEVVERYRTMTESGRDDQPLGHRLDRGGTGRMRVEQLELLDADGRPLAAVTPGQPFRFRVSGTIREPVSAVEASVDIDTGDGVRVTTLYSGFQGVQMPASGDRFRFECAVRELNLRPDLYSVNVWLGTSSEAYDFVARAGNVEVLPTDFFGGGRVPERAHGPMLARYAWTAQPTGVT